MKKLLALVLSLLPLTVGAQGVFNKYAPVAGIQKSTGLDYHNTAAAASDITPLFGCGGSSTLFLRGDGSCTAPAGTGVTSISVPAPLTASSCSGGACSITWTTGQTANRVLATPDGTTGAVSLRALVAGDIPPIALGSTANGGVASASILLGTNGGTSNAFFSVTGPTTALRTFTFPNASATVLTTNAAVTVPQGGTGLATLPVHGVLLGEGTSNLGNVAAMAADTLLMGQGVTSDPAPVAVNNCGSATSALSYSTSTHTFGCQTITSGGTGTVTSITGGTGINASPNPLISSGTLTVDQGFSPTWTGSQTFSGNQVVFTGSSAGFNPQAWCDTGLSAGSRCFAMRIGGGGDLQLAVATDAFVPGNAAIDIGRSGTAVTAINLGNASDNPTFAFLGTGGVTATGQYTVKQATTAGYGIFTAGDSTGSRVLQILSVGSTATPTYGIPAGSAGIDTTGSASLTFSTADTAREVISANGNVTINAPSSGDGLTLNGAANSTILTAIASTTSGQSFGIRMKAGTTSADYAINITNGGNTSTLMLLSGDGGLQIGTPTGGDKGLGTVNMTGCFVNNVPCLTGASTATRFTAGVITIGASSCTVNQNTSGVSGCTFNSTGNVTVTFSSAFTAATCVANAVNANPTLLASQPGTSITSGVQINLDNTSGTPTNGILSVLCLGN